ncbi:hypothetical protein MF672_018080 [Actinomadura sp. ATCC 31491]|uniref:Uncharacterized protein n=1 Tax=Actinomadura luzonensis TaxID=2805427 RepID=A0ABT0FTU4_9ACTN|nr:hypothetical protein [Actinomadura luzonensis]MCK2215684.1 hypothetical protein [Actinomadura luzonensis]
MDGSGKDPRPGELRAARSWLARHGLGDTPPTPLLAARLAARWRARVVEQVLLALLIMTAAAVYAFGVLSGPGGSGPLVLLGGLVVALLAARWQVEAWVRRVDRRAGAALARRAAHPVQLGWRALLGRPHAACAAGIHAAALALAAGAFATGDTAVRRAAAVLLVALAGAAAAAVLQLRDLLRRPVVAEDEVSLTADVIMRIEDARESMSPGVVWSLPVILLLGPTFGWWSAVSVGLVPLGLAAVALVQLRAPSTAAMARRIVAP